MGRLLAYRMMAGAVLKMSISFSDMRRYFKMRKM
ncbi:MAG: hypothetical protein QOG80_3377 [Pseudonocardiales bacterium]|jgi:hypothetical protein|nr:hypothetical protein [Pseudonocardiales bacterium]